VLVHRNELLKQWQERLQSFLGVGKNIVGTIGGGKAKPTGKIDIAVMQSLSRKGEINPLVENYGHVIVDECHHIGAVSFDAILKRVKAKYVLGLTATPIRRDGQQAIIFMQCGPIRYTASKPLSAPHDLAVMPCMLHASIELPQDAPIQDVFRYLANDAIRTVLIANEIQNAYKQGRKVLVLTERTDYPPLDTLVLAMPISWKGTLQQYAGRLHREHASKTDVRIIDCVDTGHPALLRMWDKRQRGYRAMGYRIVEQPTLSELSPAA
jgi:superfamily II DNA or RNA helicase